MVLFLPRPARADLVELDLMANDVAESHGAIFARVDSSTITNGRLAAFLQINGAGVAGDYNRKKALKFREVPVVTLNETNYLQFALDVQGMVVSVDTIEIFTASGQTGIPNDLGAIGVKRWDLDKSCWNYATQDGSGCDPAWDDVVVQVDPRRNIRQSGIDLFLYIPVANFADAQPDDLVYFFCVFGNPHKPMSAGIPMYPKVVGAAKWGILKVLQP